MEKSREDVKNELLKNISEHIENSDSEATKRWVVIFGEFLSALDIEPST